MEEAATDIYIYQNGVPWGGHKTDQTVCARLSDVWVRLSDVWVRGRLGPQRLGAN